LNNKEEIKDVISAESSEKAQSKVDSLNYGVTFHLTKLEKENIDQIKIAQGEEITSEIPLKLEDAMRNLVALFREVRGFEDDEPLNSDEVDELVSVFRWFADHQQGNITDEEYHIGISELHK